MSRVFMSAAVASALAFGGYAVGASMAGADQDTSRPLVRASGNDCAPPAIDIAPGAVRPGSEKEALGTPASDAAMEAAERRHAHLALWLATMTRDLRRDLHDTINRNRWNTGTMPVHPGEA